MERPKILIIEDEAAQANLLAHSLEQNGYLVMVAQDGERGLTMALEHHPDLILLDIILPKKDGITVLKELRQDAWGATIPIIILTCLSDAEKQVAAIDSKVADYLIKSDWNIEAMVQKVKQRLTRGQV